MPYYLKHYFMPDFNHKRLRPVAMADGSTSMHYLGYVQNVVAGQVLAELISLDDVPAGTTPPEDIPPLAPPDGQQIPLPEEQGYPEHAGVAHEEEEREYWDFLQNLRSRDPRFIYDQPIFPLGPNCGRDLRNPNRIIALASGYCFYHQGLITVKKLLNVRQDVGFHTGNITFVGDIVVHGDVYPGFSLNGTSILVKGRIDGGKIHARGNVVGDSGIKGAPDAIIRAGLTVRITNCERATIITPGNLIVDGNALHCTLYVGGSLIINGSLQGGSVYAGNIVYVKERLGHSKGAPTKITLGYDPVEYLRLQDITLMEQEQARKLEDLARDARKGPDFSKECAPFQELAQRKLAILQDARNRSWRKLASVARRANRARAIVPGIIHPGVEIAIGQACHKVIDEQRNIFFSLHEGEIVHGYPAITRNWSPASSDDESAP